MLKFYLFDVLKFVAIMQACLKEIHAKMLRRQLHRLEQPLHDKKIEPEEEKIEEEETEEEVDGMGYF